MNAVVWAVDVLTYWLPCIPAVVLEAKALCYYYRLPGMFLHSDLPERVLNVNVKAIPYFKLIYSMNFATVSL